MTSRTGLHRSTLLICWTFLHALYIWGCHKAHEPPGKAQWQVATIAPALSAGSATGVELPMQEHGVWNWEADRFVICDQVVRSALLTEKGKEVVMFWYLEAIEMPEKPHGLFSESHFLDPSLCLVVRKSYGWCCCQVILTAGSLPLAMQVCWCLSACCRRSAVSKGISSLEDVMNSQVSGHVVTVMAGAQAGACCSASPVTRSGSCAQQPTTTSS